MARDLLARLDGHDWRVDWYLGLAELLEHDYEQAYAYFDAVRHMLPGELAPMLALAATAELIATQANASKPGRASATQLYAAVWRTDYRMVSAAFGLARQLIEDRRVEEAVQVLDEVPSSSRHYTEARIAAVAALLTATDPSESIFHDAAARVQDLPASDDRTARLRTATQNLALAWLRADNMPRQSDATLFGVPFTEHELRRAARPAGFTQRVRVGLAKLADTLQRSLRS